MQQQLPSKNSSHIIQNIAAAAAAAAATILRSEFAPLGVSLPHPVGLRPTGHPALPQRFQ